MKKKDRKLWLDERADSSLPLILIVMIVVVVIGAIVYVGVTSQAATVRFSVEIPHDNITDWAAATAGFGSNYISSVNSNFTVIGGQLSLNTLNLSHNNISDWVSATAAFLTSDDDSAYLTASSPLSWSQVTGAPAFLTTVQIPHGNITDWAAATAGFGSNYISLGELQFYRDRRATEPKHSESEP